MEQPALYREMARARAFERAAQALWEAGAISGELHLGTGEEAVAAGVVHQLQPDDALALTHRGTPALVVRGVPLVPLLRELMGHEQGLCGGRGGHMHLFSRSHRAATSGIVGASLPAGVGLALAAKRQRPGSVAVAFTGTGALNQGMALEALNLAVVWQVPLLVVCVDNGWEITTPAGSVTAGDLVERAAAFGLVADRVDGTDVDAVHRATAEALGALRRGEAPRFLLARTPRLDGHYLGDVLSELVAHPLGRERGRIGDIVGAAASGSPVATARGLWKLTGVMARARMEAKAGGRGDPLEKARRGLPRAEAEAIDAAVAAELDAAVQEATHA